MTLSEIKQKTVNHYAGWWTIIGIDPIAFRLVWLMQRVCPRLNPNVITVGSLFTGLWAAFALSQGDYLAGGLLYQLAFLLDCLDGKMARLQGRSSNFGGFFDGLINSFVYCAGLIGLAASQLDDLTLLGGVAGSLLLYVLGQEMAFHQKVHGGASSSRAPSEAIGLLARLRENKPLMWPDRHLAVFLICPLLGYAAAGVLANLLIDIVLQTRRFICIAQQK